MQEKLSAQIEGLQSLNKAELLAIWAENFSKDPPPNLRKELMVPILAYRMQEREFGGLSHGARRRLREVAASLTTEQPSQERADSAPQTGTRLLRMWLERCMRSLQLGMAIYIVDRPTPACPRSPGRSQGHGGPDHCSLDCGSRDCSSSLRCLYPQIF